MKKFGLLFLVPLLIVMGAYSFELEGYETDYPGEDVAVDFVDNEDGTFRFVISNYTDDTIYVNYDDSFFCALDYDFNVIEDTAQPIFSDDEIDNYMDFIESGMYLGSEPYYFADDIELAGYYILIEVDGEEYTWISIISDY